MLIDLHCDTITKLKKTNQNLVKNDMHIDIQKLHKAESLAQFFAIFVYLDIEECAYTRCKDLISLYNKEIIENKDSINFAYSHNDIITNELNGRISSILTIEEGGVIQGDMNKLHEFYNLGVRLITLTWNFENEIAYPNSEYKHKDDGLKEFGIDVIKEMNKLGMIIDVSHLSDAGFYDCINYSSKPIVASHSNARAVHDHSRNLSDEMIYALSENGGIMGMNLYGKFLNGTGKSYTKDVVKHIKYIRDLVGVDVIAVGTDFDGITCDLEISDISKINMLKEELIKENFTEDEIEKIFYKNALRVIKNTIG